MWLKKMKQAINYTCDPMQQQDKLTCISITLNKITLEYSHN